MYTSKLIRTTEAYDPYGLHRLDGVKIVYILLILFVVNGLYGIQNPYFYYFYMPVTALSAEVMKETIPEKYQAFIYTIAWSCLAILLFNMLRPYPLFFLFATFAISTFLYVMALKRVQMMVPLVPVVLSLAAYSLLYPATNMNLRMMLSNISHIVLSTTVIIGALILFPLSYYYRAWLRATRLVYKALGTITSSTVAHKTLDPLTTQKHIKYMLMFSKMIPHHLPFYSILKITLLTHELYLKCASEYFHHQTPYDDLKTLQENIQLLCFAIESETPCSIFYKKDKDFVKIVNSWNSLCLRT